ncbi:MAG: UDP-N-acetylmuramate dehydrogenase [Candidatus Dormibacteria bacterium]
MLRGTRGVMVAAPERLLAITGMRRGEPLARRTTLGVGGPADLYLETSDTAVLAEALGLAAGQIPVTFIGRGSNLVVADQGVEGLVVRWRGVRHRFEDDRAIASAGLEHARLARFAADAGLAGLEFAAGIPGAVGGGVTNNAGAFGSDFSAVVAEVRGLSPSGDPRSWDASTCRFGYRTSRFREDDVRACLTEVVFSLTHDEPTAVRERIESVAARRRQTQPVRHRSVGSTFKNPPGDFAARLIDAAGLKGFRVGDAEVSREHANFTVNLGDATAAQIRALVDQVAGRVQRQFGIRLEPEVEFVGRWS